MDIVTYALAKKMASSVASGITEVKTNGTNISFKTAEGEWFTVKLNSVDGATVSATGHLIIKLTDGTTIDAGVLPVGPMDTALSTTSENGVQNKVVTAALNGKQNALTAGTGVTIDTTDPANPEISANVDYTKLINKPTKLSDFTDDQGFIDNTVNNLTNYYLKTETYTQTEVNGLISQLTSLSVEIVETLPTENISTTTIYLVNVSGTTNYAQWMYINSAWANIGNTSVDLSNYYTKGQADTLLESKIDKVLGKGLSTNDFSNAYKDMLDNYTVDSVLDPSSTNPIQNKTVTDALNTKQPKTLSAPIVVGGVTSSTVEGTLSNLNALVDTKLTMVTSLPVSPSNGDAVLYIGTSSGGLKAGGIYQYQVSEWVLISYAESFTFNSDDFGIDSSTNEVSLSPSRRVFNGTKADWDLMTTAEKTQYGATAFTDDEGGVGGYVENISLTQNTSSAYKVIELKAIRMGNIINVVGIVEVIAQMESLTIATGFPPPLILQDTTNSIQIYLSGQRGTNSGGQSARITKDGELIVYTSTSGGNYYFSGSYIA